MDDVIRFAVGFLLLAVIGSAAWFFNDHGSKQDNATGQDAYYSTYR